MDFMQGIGGAVTSYKVDIEASKKLNDIEEVIKLVKETFSYQDSPYADGILDFARMIDEIVKK